MSFKRKYRENRPEWLSFSKRNLTRFPKKSDRYKAFLREHYPKQEGYTASKLCYWIERLNLRIPLMELIKYGEECNWLTRDGKPFKNIAVFCTVYNGVWINKEIRKNNQTSFLWQDLQHTEQSNP